MQWSRNMRVAIANTGKSKEVAKYLPSNYRVLGRTLDNTGTIIIGVDDHGWTMEQYIIPRLASGMIHCEEVTHEEGKDWGDIMISITPSTTDAEIEKYAKDTDAAIALLTEIRDEVKAGIRISPPQVILKRTGARNEEA